MKYVLLSPAHPLRGGIAASTERLARELQAFGHEVIIYSFSLQYPGFLFPGKTQYTDEPAPADLEIRTKVNSVNPFNWIKVGLELKSLAPDAIISRFWLPFMAPSIGTICRIARSANTKILSIADNIIPHEKRPGDRMFTNYYIGATDGFVVMSQSVGDDIRKFDKDKPVKMVPHPIYDNYGDVVSQGEALNHLGLSQDYRYILFFGFIREYKGLDLLYKAMNDKRIRRMPIKLIVAGEYYGNEDHYDEMVRVLDIGEQLELRTEFIATEEVKYYFSAADLVVQPYKTATQSGISQIGYHFEKPMVVTKVGGLPEIVPHGKVGYVVDVNETAIADAIIDFYTNERGEAFSKGAKQEKEKYSWGNLVKALEELT
ncbi:MAG: glycosyltransferase [Saprospiraceae bacterium]